MNSGERGVAGASARREHERRRAKDEQKRRDDWGPLGGLAVALSSERQTTSAWAQGATGEERVGAALDRISSDAVHVLHDRRIPGSRANIDHIVITGAGVWVIDTKRYKDARPTLRVEGGFLRPRVETLTVRGRDESRLVTGVLRQVERVGAVLPGVPVRGVLCFVEAEWPLRGGDFTVAGVSVCWPKGLVASITSTPPADFDVDAIAAALTARFRQA